VLVKYKIVGAVSNYALLFDESAGDANEKFAPSFRDLVEKIPGYGSPSEARIPMGNTACTLPFRWSSNYATSAAGAAAIANLRSTFKGVAIHLQVTVGTGSGATVLYFPNAVLTASAHDQHGCEVAHQLTFETSDVTTTAP
jgi:hypothetical protein